MVQETTQLKQAVADEILTNSRLNSRLQLNFGKSYLTIRRWAQTNNVILTTLTALQIIAEETGKDIKDIVEN